MKHPGELTRWVPILVLFMVYPTLGVAVGLLVHDYLWTGLGTFVGLATLYLINRGLHPKED